MSFVLDEGCYFEFVNFECLKFNFVNVFYFKLRKMLYMFSFKLFIIILLYIFLKMCFFI